MHIYSHGLLRVNPTNMWEIIHEASTNLLLNVVNES